MENRIVHQRVRSWGLLAALSLVLGHQASCLAVIQNELEVLFAPEAGSTALLIPQSILYNLFGPVIWRIASFLT